MILEFSNVICSISDEVGSVLQHDIDRKLDATYVALLASCIATPIMSKYKD